MSLEDLESFSLAEKKKKEKKRNYQKVSKGGTFCRSRFQHCKIDYAYTMFLKSCVKALRRGALFAFDRDSLGRTLWQK